MRSPLVVKLKVTSWHLWADTEGRWKYSAVQLQPVLRDGWWSEPHCGHFRPFERRATHCTEAGLTLGLICLAWKISPTPLPLGFDPQTIQPVANSYTNYAILVPLSVPARQHYHIACNLFFHIFHVSVWRSRVSSPLFIQPASSPSNSTAVITSHVIFIIIFKYVDTQVLKHMKKFCS